jgi:hypothetical protein
MLLNMCHPACPVDPLSHRMICLQEEDAPAYDRAMEAQAGVKRTQAQWEQEATEQTELQEEQATLDARRQSGR